ncbi:hypothetical protein BC834DRAFT_842146 [Gloeopeniophorella convolvens]|nr:hypothetical protein BC834DRAFT_842146 [Gloeopeniophorella convolvens]
MSNYTPNSFPQIATSFAGPTPRATLSGASYNSAGASMAAHGNGNVNATHATFGLTTGMNDPHDNGAGSFVHGQNGRPYTLANAFGQDFPVVPRVDPQVRTTELTYPDWPSYASLLPPATPYTAPAINPNTFMPSATLPVPDLNEPWPTSTCASRIVLRPWANADQSRVDTVPQTTPPLFSGHSFLSSESSACGLGTLLTPPDYMGLPFAINLGHGRQWLSYQRQWGENCSSGGHGTAIPPAASGGYPFDGPVPGQQAPSTFDDFIPSNVPNMGQIVPLTDVPGSPAPGPVAPMASAVSPIVPSQLSWAFPVPAPAPLMTSRTRACDGQEEVIHNLPEFPISQLLPQTTLRRPTSNGGKTKSGVSTNSARIGPTPRLRKSTAGKTPASTNYKSRPVSHKANMLADLAAQGLCNQFQLGPMAQQELRVSPVPVQLTWHQEEGGEEISLPADAEVQHETACRGAEASKPPKGPFKMPSRMQERARILLRVSEGEESLGVVDNIQCRLCGTYSGSWPSWTRHVNAHESHPNKVHKCACCGLWFARKSRLESHQKEGNDRCGVDVTSDQLKHNKEYVERKLEEFNEELLKQPRGSGRLQMISFDKTVEDKLKGGVKKNIHRQS